MGKLVIFVFVGLILNGIFGSPLSQPSPKLNTSRASLRIVGGQNANIEDYPYQVSIMIDGQHACGGSILTTTFILTAAHCFADESRVSHITVRSGSSLRTSGGTITKVKKINSNSKFNADTFDYDVAVMELASPLTLSNTVSTIALPSSSSQVTDGQTSVVTGWGLTSNNGDLSSQLQMVTIPLISTKTCQSTVYGSAITSRMICAGSAGKDSCTGDSGGPLVSNGVQVGIVSWGDVCGAATTPGVYTKITEFLSFINGIITTRSKL